MNDVSKHLRRPQLSIEEIELIVAALSPLKIQPATDLRERLKGVIAEEYNDEARAMRELYRSAAENHADDELEVNEDAEVAIGADRGAFVQVWLWISNDELPEITCMSCGEKTNLADSPDGEQCHVCHAEDQDDEEEWEE